ncbi:MAG: PAS domain S-box protein [Magnetospirillum sp.]|nr:PAS domain S-box protein [Magnetospirillum sp.]
MTLRVKLLLPLALICLASLGYVFGVWMPKLRADAEAELLHSVSSHLDSVVEGLIPPLLASQIGLVHENLGALMATNRDWVSLVVEDSRGRPVFPLAGRPPAVAAAGQEPRYLAKDIESGGAVLGRLTAVIDIAPRVAADRARFSELGMVFLLLTGAMVAAVYLVLEGSVMRPARQLARASRALARQDFAWPLPPPSNDEIGALVGAFTDMREARKRTEAVLADRTRSAERSYRNLRQLSAIMALPPAPAVAQLGRALALGSKHLGMEFAVLSKIDGDTYTVLLHNAPASAPLKDGARFAVGETCCAITLEADNVVAIPHMGDSPHAGHPCYRGFGREAYIGAPIRVHGRLFGTVSFSSTAPYPRRFDEGDIEFVRLLAGWAGSCMERDLASSETFAAKEDADAARRQRELILASPEEGIIGITQNGSISFINPAARRMFGWEAGEGIGVTMHDAVHHHHADGTVYARQDCPMFHTLTAGEVRRVDKEVYWRKNGTCFPVEYAVTPIMEQGAITGAVVVFTDITQRLAAEAELKRSNTELEQFAYVASHDLREPLRMIGSYVALLERRYGAQLDEEAHEFIAFARDGAERMDRLIRDLLEYSRIGRIAQPKAAQPLKVLVDDALLMLQVKLEEVAAVVHVDPALDAVAPVFVCRDEVVRLFQNLVGNAAKYRDPARPPVISISARAEAGWATVSVADNGIGIPPEYFERIFLIFQRLHSRDQYEGTGIGLSICKKIVERHGGRISVESVVGEGATFHVTLPLA